jgi:hypothetical protein
MGQDTKTDVRPLLWQDLAEITKTRVMDALRERLAKGQPIPALGLLDLLTTMGFEFSHKVMGSAGTVHIVELQVWLRPFVDDCIYVRDIGYV